MILAPSICAFLLADSSMMAPLGVWLLAFGSFVIATESYFLFRSYLIEKSADTEGKQK